MTKNAYSQVIEKMSSVFGSFSSGESLMTSISPEEIQEIAREKTFVTCTFGGGINVIVKNGRVVQIDH